MRGSVGGGQKRKAKAHGESGSAFWGKGGEELKKTFEVQADECVVLVLADQESNSSKNYGCVVLAVREKKYQGEDS